MSNFMRILAVAALAVPGSWAWALDANEVANMSKAKAGDEVIVAQIKATKARFALTADDIIRLKKEGVSDAVIKVMIESAGMQQASEPAPPPQERTAAQPEPSRASAPEPPPVRIVEPEPQPVQTTVIEKHYYETPPPVYYPAPVTTYYYVPATPVYRTVCRPAYGCDSYYRGSHVDIGVYGQVRLSRHLSLGFRF